MESNWRLGVWEMIGPVRFDSGDGGFGLVDAKLCAELNPHVVLGGVTYSHILLVIDGAGNRQPLDGRLLTENVLREFRIPPYFALHFPFGYTVLPD